MVYREHLSVFPTRVPWVVPNCRTVAIIPCMGLKSVQIITAWTLNLPHATFLGVAVGWQSASVGNLEPVSVLPL